MLDLSQSSINIRILLVPGWMHETTAQGWCTGKTQRDGMGREIGGGIGMGNTCKSMADIRQCMAKPLQYCKVISLQLIKINEKKRILLVLNVIVIILLRIDNKFSYHL